MTDNEINLTCEALRYLVGYEDSNPDVGFGPSLESLLDNVLRRANITLSTREKVMVLGVYKIKGYRSPR